VYRLRMVEAGTLFHYLKKYKEDRAAFVTHHLRGVTQGDRLGRGVWDFGHRPGQPVSRFRGGALVSMPRGHRLSPNLVTKHRVCCMVCEISREHLA
jgi:hypothetical protein